MRAKYSTANSITVSVGVGEFWAHNAGPMEVTFLDSDAASMQELAGNNVTPEPFIEPPPEFPEITRRQIRLWLLSKGISVADVDAEIEKLPEPQRSVAKIEWDGATFQRNNQFVNMIGPALGFASQQMDTGWREAAVL